MSEAVIYCSIYSLSVADRLLLLLSIAAEIPSDLLLVVDVRTGDLSVSIRPLTVQEQTISELEDTDLAIASS
jgi:hypothetical protein